MQFIPPSRSKRQVKVSMMGMKMIILEFTDVGLQNRHHSENIQTFHYSKPDGNWAEDRFCGVERQ